MFSKTLGCGNLSGPLFLVLTDSVRKMLKNVPNALTFAAISFSLSGCQPSRLHFCLPSSMLNPQLVEECYP